jgi:hypothetical protein
MSTPRTLLHQSNGQRTYAVVVRRDDDVMECLKRFSPAVTVTERPAHLRRAQGPGSGLALSQI